jgi:glycosyltransferase involved in cell wall biosynthesis
VEILESGGGVVAATGDEWREALTRLADDPRARQAAGARARATVRERYSTPVIAMRYHTLLARLAGEAAASDAMVPASAGGSVHPGRQ